MVTIGFIGLGTMGAPMARNLRRAGHDVVGFNRSPAAMESFAADGGRTASSAAEAAAGADVVVTVLPDSPDVETVVLGDEGVLAQMGTGTLLVDCSTIAPSVARAVAAAGAARGVEVLDAPVSGGQRGAEDASLAIMVGGTADAFARGAPLLEAMGSTVVHVGAAGAGQTVKAANQVLVGGTIGLVAEALVLLDRAGIEAGPALRVLGGGLAGSAVLERKSPAMLSGDFTPTFRAALHLKDLEIAASVIDELGIDAPFTELARAQYRQLVAEGMGDLDHAALHELVVRRSRSARDPLANYVRDERRQLGTRDEHG